MYFYFSGVIIALLILVLRFLLKKTDRRSIYSELFISDAIMYFIAAWTSWLTVVLIISIIKIEKKENDTKKYLKQYRENRG